MSTVTRENLVSNKDKYPGEALALQKLIMPLVSRGTLEKENIPFETPLKVPDNNPFRIRSPEEISLFSSVEYMDVCMSPDSFQEEKSENLLRKRKFQTNCSDQVEISDEQVSAVTVTEVEEDPDILCWTVESQESVNSKITKVADSKRRAVNEKKSKRSNHKKTGGKNSSILNFFSRV